MIKLEPGMIIKGGEPGRVTEREIISVGRQKITFRIHRTSQGMTCNRTYTTTIQGFYAWAKQQVTA